MTIAGLKESLGLLVLVAVIGGRFWLLEDRVETMRLTCATLTTEIRELREQIREAQKNQTHQKPVLE